MILVIRFFLETKVIYLILTIKGLTDLNISDVWTFRVGFLIRLFLSNYLYYV